MVLMSLRPGETVAPDVADYHDGWISALERIVVLSVPGGLETRPEGLSMGTGGRGGPDVDAA
jgi:hypothetical protein